LSHIEGIDELARQNGAGEMVESLTAEAMGSSGINLELYQKRLDLVRPSQEQVLALGEYYFQQIVPDVNAVIQILKRLNKTIYLVSAGLYPSIAIFGKLLGISPKNIYAVDIKFNAENHYLDFDHQSPLVDRLGKRIIVEQLKEQNGELIYIGDGLNDYAAYDLVTRFIGYGGVFYRENIAAFCQFYISTLSMAPLLPLSLTMAEYESLTIEEKKVYRRGLDGIQEGKVKVC